MERDLCDLMANGGDYFNETSYNTEDEYSNNRSFDSRDLGTAMTFGDMLAEERSLSDLLDFSDDPAELLEAIEAEHNQDKIQRISLKSRQADVPAFEQYVYQKCGITR